MDFIAEILANALLAIGIFIAGWCIRHKDVTKIILVICIMIADVIFLLNRFGIINI